MNRYTVKKKNLFPWKINQDGFTEPTLSWVIIYDNPFEGNGWDKE